MTHALTSYFSDQQLMVTELGENNIPLQERINTCMDTDMDTDMDTVTSKTIQVCIHQFAVANGFTITFIVKPRHLGYLTLETADKPVYNIP